jgi:hypothetical protein
MTDLSTVDTAELYSAHVATLNLRGFRNTVVDGDLASTLHDLAEKIAAELGKRPKTGLNRYLRSVDA